MTARVDFTGLYSHGANALIKGNDGYRELVANAILLAIEDMVRGTVKLEVREEAEAWLVRGEGAEWMVMLGVVSNRQEVVRAVNRLLHRQVEF